METDEDEQGDAAGETTLYFDAEEGVLRTEDGEAVAFDLGSQDDEEDGDDAEEGAQTPQPAQSNTAAVPQPQQAQTITSMSTIAFPTVPPQPADTIGRFRRFSAATQQRVSTSHFFVQWC